MNTPEFALSLNVLLLVGVAVLVIRIVMLWMNVISQNYVVSVVLVGMETVSKNILAIG